MTKHGNTCTEIIIDVDAYQYNEHKPHVLNLALENINKTRVLNLFKNNKKCQKRIKTKQNKMLEMQIQYHQHHESSTGNKNTMKVFNAFKTDKKCQKNRVKTKQDA
jgi:3-polyprenyl-4-hydroxybenzoate decarboxylase